MNQFQYAVPSGGLTTAELAQDLLSRIERGSVYARSRKNRFRVRSSSVKVASLVLSVASTIILGLQKLNPWTGIAFSLIAIVTVVNTLEPFFAWRLLWVLMENTQYRFYRLRDELTYYIAATPSDQLDEAGSTACLMNTSESGISSVTAGRSFAGSLILLVRSHRTHRQQ
jgi:hypothetical protein